MARCTGPGDQRDALPGLALWPSGAVCCPWTRGHLSNLLGETDGAAGDRPRHRGIRNCGSDLYLDWGLPVKAFFSAGAARNREYAAECGPGRIFPPGNAARGLTSQHSILTPIMYSPTLQEFTKLAAE